MTYKDKGSYGSSPPCSHWYESCCTPGRVMSHTWTSHAALIQVTHMNTFVTTCVTCTLQVMWVQIMWHTCASDVTQMRLRCDTNAPQMWHKCDSSRYRAITGEFVRHKCASDVTQMRLRCDTNATAHGIVRSKESSLLNGTMISHWVANYLLKGSPSFSFEREYHDTSSRAIQLTFELTKISALYRVAKTHRRPNLHRSFSAQEPYD